MASSKPDAPAPNPAPLRIGFLGAGGFARLLAGSLDAHLTQPTVVCDPALTDLPTEFLRARQVASWLELAAADDVDIVVVATTPWLHEEQVCQALAAGKHVFTEGPLATTTAGAARVVAAQRAAGRFVQVDHALLFSPIYRALRRLGGDFAGMPLLSRMRRYACENDASDEGLPPGHWFWDGKLGGGIAITHAGHFFAGARMLRGDDPARISALTTGLADPDVIDTFLINAAYADGGTASQAHAFTHHARAEMQLTCLDFGEAKCVIEGWIPVRATLDVWTDNAGAAAWHELPARSAELLAVPHFQLPAKSGIRVVDIPHGFAATAHSRAGTAELPRRLSVVIDLGGEEAKGYLYGQGVRAAFSDLASAVRAGRRPCSPATEAAHCVRTAVAAQESAETGTVVLA